MQWTVRNAEPGDRATMLTIAAEGGSPDADAEHLGFLSAAGRLLVADGPGGVAGFVGVLEVDGASMVTDLFVASAHRGRGIGGALLRSSLPDGVAAFTFASADPAALAAYRRVGMEVRWPLLTMRGTAEGGSLLTPRPWSGGNSAVARHLATSGAVSTGYALVTQRGEMAHLHRVEAPVEVAVGALAEVCSGLPAGTTIELSVPADSVLLAWLVLHGFRVVDVDIHCATPGFVLDPRLAAVHRGLG